MSRRLLPVLVMCGSGLLACPVLTSPPRPELSSFAVVVKGVFQRTGSTRAPVPVVTQCTSRYGGQAKVPPEVKGTVACRYQIPRGEIEFDIEATALDARASPLRSFNGPVAFRVRPGDLGPGYEGRWAQAREGQIAATVRVLHQYGQVHVWVEDAPPLSLVDGGQAIDPLLPGEGSARTFATGISEAIFFDDQTLQSLQLPDGFDNRSSPFVGQFISVGKNPESGETLLQNCADDPLRDQQPALMVVTGLDPAGFFVTDLSGCRLLEKTSDASGTQVRTPEEPERCLVEQGSAEPSPIETTDAGQGVCEISRRACVARSSCQRYLPGTFGSMFVYNYNFPDGLYEGDLLFTLSGAVQEFTSTTQMVFPAWTIAESVHRLPEDQWNKWLKFARPHRLGGRTCGWDNSETPYLTDQLCGHNRRNLKMESLESALVTLTQTRLPTVLGNCDANGDGVVPLICENGTPSWHWDRCSFDRPETPADRAERLCLQDCIFGTGPHAGKVCSDATTYKSFGQFLVELAPAGPAWAGLDDSLPARFHSVTVTAGGPSERAAGFPAGSEVAIVCDQKVRYRVGDAKVSAGSGDAVLAAKEIVRRVLSGQDTWVAFSAEAATAQCSVGLNGHARLSVVAQDGALESDPTCQEDDPDETRARECRFLHGATFDITGHLRHIQAARPRWAVIPRGLTDVCCHPGPGLECPTPITRCP